MKQSASQQTKSEVFRSLHSHDLTCCKVYLLQYSACVNMSKRRASGVVSSRQGIDGPFGKSKHLHSDKNLTHTSDVLAHPEYIPAISRDHLRDHLRDPQRPARYTHAWHFRRYCFVQHSACIGRYSFYIYPHVG